MIVVYATFFQYGQDVAKCNISVMVVESILRQAFLAFLITEDQEEAFWDGFYSLPDRSIYYV